MLDKEILEIEVVWNDADLLELNTIASNGRYAGIVNTYTQDTYLQEFASKLLVFPKTISDTIIFESDYRLGNSSLSLKFYCIDGVGHTAVDINMEELSSSDSEADKSKVSFLLTCNIQQIQFFSQQLLKMANNREGIANLIKVNQT
ncbi:MAG: hypothetical protein ACR2J3_02280 [Aridibacter sp.]